MALIGEAAILEDFTAERRIPLKSLLH